MVVSLTEHFDTFQIQRVPRSDNTRADILSKLASTKKKGRYKSLLQHTLATPSIDQQNQCLNITTTNTWMEPFIKYLEAGVTPSNEEKGWVRKAARYTLIGGELFRRGFSKPLLKCISREKADYIIQEIHQGICGYHSRPKTMAARILRAGYYWPTMEEDCTTYVQKCVQCQKHRPITHMHQEELHHVSSPWPFSKWGMDIIGPFAAGKGQVKFLLVAVDYFSKWIEAEPLATITANQVQRFVWKNIIYRYGIPHTIITDNGRYSKCHWSSELTPSHYSKCRWSNELTPSHHSKCRWSNELTPSHYSKCRWSNELTPSHHSKCRWSNELTPSHYS